MIPMRHSSIFKSRWIALVWAAGILWSAYDVAGSAPSPDDVALTDKAGANVHAYCALRDVSRSTAGNEEKCNRFACNPDTGTCFRSCTTSDQCGTNFRCDTTSGICRLPSEMSGPDEG